MRSCKRHAKTEAIPFDIKRFSNELIYESQGGSLKLWKQMKWAFLDMLHVIFITHYRDLQDDSFMRMVLQLVA
jgi:hypothetical protein